MAQRGTKIIKGKPISGAGALSKEIATTSHVKAPCSNCGCKDCTCKGGKC